LWSIEIVKRAKVRRAKLYYLREAKGKKGRLKAKAMGVAVEEPTPPPPSPEEAATEQTEPETETEDSPAGGEEKKES